MALLAAALAAPACSSRAGAPRGDALANDLEPPPDSAIDLAEDGGIADQRAADLVGETSPDPCITAPAAGTSLVQCEDLSFYLTVPPACPGGGCGLIVDVHGLSMSGAMQDNNTGMRALGAQHGFIVVQPNARPAPPLASWSPADDAKVFAFMQRVIAVFQVDAKRVHFTGFSQGGAMSWRFFCNYGEHLASAAPAADCTAVGPLGCFGGGKPAPPRLPLLYMHGTGDVLVGFSCAEGLRDAVVDAWQLQQDQVVSSDDHHSWTRFVGPEGAHFELVEHDYAAASPLLGGHCFPGSEDLAGGEPGQLFPFGCTGESAFDWGEIVIAFFIAHPRP